LIRANTTHNKRMQSFSNERVFESIKIGHTLSITVLNTDGSTVRVKFGSDVPMDVVKIGVDAIKEMTSLEM